MVLMVHEGVCVLSYDNSCMSSAAFKCSDHSTGVQVVLSPAHTLRAHVPLKHKRHQMEVE